MALPFLPHSEFTHNEISEVKAAETQKDTVYGDVNSDGKITILDMIALKSYLTEKNTKGFSVKAADLDEDGEVSAKDAVELSMYLLNSIGSFSNELNTDTDGDGLSDYVEKEILKTDHTMKDTDGDGLDDYSEIYFCDTNPLLTDTGETGTKDPFKDADGDKLTNSEELKLGTSPALADTDEDGLEDYDEVNKYKTDPLSMDTDNDKISDYGEVKLGLDPLKEKSDGKILDVERTFVQSLSSDSNELKSINTDDISYRLGVEVKAAGYVSESLSAHISAYSNFLQNDAIVGDIIDIDYEDSFKIDSITVNFTVPENPENFYVFRYFDDVNMLLPIETFYDENRVYTEYTEDGTYCLVNLNKMFVSNQSSAYAELMYNSSASSTTHLMFLIDSHLATDVGMVELGYYNVIKDQIEIASKNILTNYDNVVIEIGCTIKNTSGETITYFPKENIKKVEDVVSSLNAISEIYGTSNRNLCEIMFDAANNFLKQGDTNILCMFPAANIDVNSNSTNGNDIVKKLSQNNDLTSFVILPYYPSNFIPNTLNYMQEYIDALNSKVLYRGDINQLSDYILNSVNGTEYISALGKTVKLKKELNIDCYNAHLKKLTKEEKDKMGLIDSDGDGFYDYEEVMWEYITVKDGKIILPTIKELYSKNVISKDGLDKFKANCAENGINIDYESTRILVLKSAPTLLDSDGDGIPDIDDKNPSNEDVISVDDSLINDDNIFDDSYKPISSREVLGKGIAFSNGDGKKNTVIRYSRSFFNAKKSVSKFTLNPEHNSDYLITVDTNVSDNVKIKVYYSNWLNKPMDVSSASLNSDDRSVTEGNIKHHLFAFELKKRKKYTIEISVNPGSAQNGKYSVSFEQYNWIYAPNGGYDYTQINYYMKTETVFIDDNTLYSMIKTATDELKGEGEMPYDNINDYLKSKKNEEQVKYSTYENAKRLIDFYNANNKDLDSIIGDIGNASSLLGLGSFMGLYLIPEAQAGMILAFLSGVGNGATVLGGLTALYAISADGATEYTLGDAIYSGNYNLATHMTQSKYNISDKVNLIIYTYDGWNESHYIKKYNSDYTKKTLIEKFDGLSDVKNYKVFIK